jgi:pyridinium-3,5-biscarboxylic acid mononucleotide sulfurtransferase
MPEPSTERPNMRSEAEIVRRLAARGAAIVALSGGVDSSLVAALAAEALGARSLAVTVRGPAVAAREIDRARRVAAAVGIAHREVAVDPLARDDYRANTARRCYFCRSVETEALRAIGAANGARQYLDGIHLDDLVDDRPGIRAMDEAGFDHPLAWAGWTKREVRASARARGLPNWDQPSDACLSSRVARGEPITAELLARIERGEERVLARGFRRVRVRARAGGARVEVDPADVPRLLEEPMASEVRAELTELGFAPVVLDPRGYARSLPVVR